MLVAALCLRGLTELTLWSICVTPTKYLPSPSRSCPTYSHDNACQFIVRYWMCYLCMYNQWSPDLLWAANRWTVLRWPHTYCRPRRTHGICPPWHLSPGCYHSQHAGKTHRQGVSVQGNTVKAFSDRDCLIRIITCHSHSCIESEYDMKRWMVLV